MARHAYLRNGEREGRASISPFQKYACPAASAGRGTQWPGGYGKTGVAALSLGA
ncbi:hypothetical protein Lokhon_02128 [Limimaricola hongkongensis DSM 17492]|uniref:Uncharacterized protein n=1 Tax=Limimaricola hongkongensis DSM 17492 TaxID=1122180 RepID=A0A017HCI3_9RHOB|nr:hypothetical protein Lokhon_02128 [Limimaricola hongkongensis DSM 17492]